MGEVCFPSLQRDILNALCGLGGVGIYLRPLFSKAISWSVSVIFDRFLMELSVFTLY